MTEVPGLGPYIVKSPHVPDCAVFDSSGCRSMFLSHGANSSASRDTQSFSNDIGVDRLALGWVT
jgi:hypothetical protein